MGRSKHGNWQGFTEVRDQNNVIKGARCDKCNQILKKRDAAALSNHLKICKGPVTDPRTCNKENSSSVPLSDPALNMSVEYEITNEEHLTVSNVSSVKNEIVESTINNDCRNMNVLKFFLFYGIDISEIHSKVSKELFQSLDSKYILPSMEDFETRVLKKAVEDSYMSAFKLKDCCTMTVLSLSNESEGLVHAVSLLLDSSCNKYVYIDLCTIKSHEKDLKEELETFCKICVELVMEQYKIEVKVILYDSCVSLPVFLKIDNRKCFLSPCYSTMFQLLERGHEPFVVNSQEDLQKSLDYFNKLNEMKCKLSKSNCSLGEGAEILMQYIDNNVFDSHETAKQIVLRFLSPVALASNYFTPKYKGRKFQEFDALRKLMISFLTQVLPDSCFPALGSYKSEKEVFEHLFENLKEYETRRFWNIAKIDFKEFAENALQLASVPVINRKIDIQKIVDLKMKYEGKSESYLRLLISLIANPED